MRFDVNEHVSDRRQMIPDAILHGMGDSVADFYLRSGATSIYYEGRFAAKPSDDDEAITIRWLGNCQRRILAARPGLIRPESSGRSAADPRVRGLETSK